MVQLECSVATGNTINSTTIAVSTIAHCTSVIKLTKNHVYVTRKKLKI